MASTGECDGNAAVLVMAGTPKSEVTCLWGWLGRLSRVSEKSVWYPPGLDELEGPCFPPLPHWVGRLWNLPAPQLHEGLAATWACGACGGLHCVAAAGPRAPGLPPRGRGLRPFGPRVCVCGGVLRQASSQSPRNRRWGGSARRRLENPRARCFFDSSPTSFTESRPKPKGDCALKFGEKQIKRPSRICEPRGVIFKAWSAGASDAA